ncbi:MAG: transcriptional regulator [Clostridiales Family XIII bacterium]|nr:transcriptional regulator [Clostridiales Family XIII bacterium]
MQALDISKTKAYKIIKSCNDELKERGYITIAGKVSTEYFAEKWYGFAGKTNKDN